MELLFPELSRPLFLRRRRIFTSHWKKSGIDEDAHGGEHVGLTRGEPLTPSPPQRRQAVVAGGDNGMRIFFALHDTKSPSLQRPVYTTLLQE